MVRAPPAWEAQHTGNRTLTTEYRRAADTAQRGDL